MMLCSVAFLTACGSESYEDLAAYMAEVKVAPGGQRIDPVPTFAPYKPFDYGAISLRSPFEPPIVVRSDEIEASAIVDAPSTTRAKELLEQFNIESLRMVGTLEKDGQLWALLHDGQGNVHNVKNGNYIGKNHGKIVATSTTYIQVIEIISNGGKGWAERPRVLELKEN